jgi:amino acid transporter
MVEVLGEVSRPKKIFAKATISAMVLVIFLYLMVNVAFVWSPMAPQCLKEQN